MNYLAHYDRLMARAKNRPHPITYCELHHIIPRSHGGSDDRSNLVYLTLREHRLAHMLLAAAGHTEQWFSVKAMLDDRLNNNRPQRYRHPALKVTRYIRRKIANLQAQHRRQHPIPPARKPTTTLFI